MRPPLTVTQAGNQFTATECFFTSHKKIYGEKKERLRLNNRSSLMATAPVRRATGNSFSRTGVVCQSRTKCEQRLTRQVGVVQSRHSFVISLRADTTTGGVKGLFVSPFIFCAVVQHESRTVASVGRAPSRCASPSPACRSCRQRPATDQGSGSRPDQDGGWHTRS